VVVMGKFTDPRYNHLDLFIAHGENPLDGFDSDRLSSSISMLVPAFCGSNFDLETLWFDFGCIHWARKFGDNLRNYWHIITGWWLTYPSENYERQLG
jgi:hypothetical protein